MAFAIEISEVGPAEYPLLETLRESIFSEFGHTSRAPIAQGLANRHDLFVQIAHLEGNPLGFSAGYSRGPGLFYLNYVGVLPDYRRQGVGRQLLDRQESFARARGYAHLMFNTFNHFPGMIRLALASGFAPAGVEQHFGTCWDLAIRFEKPLSAQAQPSEATPDAPVEPHGPEIRISAGDAESLRRALDTGYLIHGIIHQTGAPRPLVLLQRVQSPTA